MHLTLDHKQLVNYVNQQVSNIFPDENPITKETLNDVMEETLSRVDFCFSKINNKYFFDGHDTVFNHLNGDQYCMFLYYLSNTMYRKGVDSGDCAKIFLLNKMLHGLDAFYEVSLPDVFMVVHPLGTVLGRGKYSDYFLVYQRCGIGSNHNIYPSLGEFVTLHPGSAVLGNSTIGKICSIAAESLVLDMNLPDNTLYIGNPKQHYFKQHTAISSFWRI